MSKPVSAASPLYPTSVIISELNQNPHVLTEKSRLDFVEGDVTVRESNSRSCTLKVRCGIYHEDYGRLPFVINDSTEHAYIVVRTHLTDDVQAIASKIRAACVAAISHRPRNYPMLPSVEETIADYIQLMEFLRESGSPSFVSIETVVTEILIDAYKSGDVVPPSVVDLLSTIPGFYVGGEGLACFVTTSSGKKFFASFEDGEYLCTEDKQIVKKLKRTLKLKQELMK